MCSLSHSFRIWIYFFIAVIYDRLVADRIFIAYNSPVDSYIAFETEP